MTNQTKKEEKKSFIKWMISNNKNQSFSYRTIRKILGRFEDIKTQMIIDNDISIIRASKTLQFEFRGEKQIITTKTLYSVTNTIDSISENFYYQKLIRLKNEGKLDKKDDLIINSILNTLKVSTIDDKVLPQTYIKTIDNRTYSNYTNIKKEDRKRIKINNNKTISLDITSSVIQLLSQTNINGFDNKLFFDMTTNSDFWSFISKKLNKTRDDVKNLFMIGIFGKYTPTELFNLYPDFFRNINKVKKEMGYKSISKIYFQIENKIMKDIMLELTLNNIHFLPLHDCLIIEELNYSIVSEIFKRNNLKYKLEY